MIARASFPLLVVSVLLVFLSAAMPATAETTATTSTRFFPTTPTTKSDGTRWRIGYVQGGNYSQYPPTTIQIAKGLQKLGWLTLNAPLPKGTNGRELWQWLATHTHSRYLQFVDDAFWTAGNFDAAQRAPMRQAIDHRIRDQGDIDLIIAMGTWAGQDMRKLGPPVPTIVASSSDPVGSGIVDSASDSGRKNLHARVVPERFQRQIRLFHEIVPFDTLGIVYENSAAGRTYAAVDAVTQVSRELGFKMVNCDAKSTGISTQQAVANAVDCYR